MSNAISFSNYNKKLSIIHKINPSIKLLSCIFLIICVFLPIHLFGYLIVLVVVSILFGLSKPSKKSVKLIIFSWAIIFVIITLINWVFFKAPALNVIKLDHILFHNPLVDKTLHEYDLDGQKIHYVLAPCYGLEKMSDVKFFKNGADVDVCLEQLKTEGYKNFFSAKKGDYWAVFGYSTTWYSISTQVFIFSAKISLQVAIMLCIATILITTTSFAELSYAIEELLSPLKIIKAPVNEISMIISIALRFIPTLIEESARVLNAQASRGVDFSNGNFKDKIKSLTCLIIPMFSISFRKAEDLANSMAARGYDPRGVRTKFRHFEPTLKDLILILFSSFLLAMFIVLAVQNKYFSFFLFIDALV